MNQAITGLLQRFAPILVLLLGVLCIVIGAMGLKNADTFTPTTAIVQSIEWIPGGADEDDSYRVIVAYTVDGVAYLTDMGEVKSNYHEGQEIDILYNPENPEQITQPGKTGPIIFIGVGAILVLAGGVMVVRRIVVGR